MAGAEATPDRRSYGRSAGLLTLALGIAGALTYAYFALASHSLSADDYGDLVILWSVVFLVASTVFRPIEQLLARTLAERDQAGVDGTDALRSAAVIQAGLCLAVITALLIGGASIERELFSGNSLLYWVLLASLAGFALAYYARGFLAGRSQFRHYSALLVIEVSARLAFAAAVALGAAGGADLVALGIATAPVACIIVLPLAVAARSSASAQAVNAEQPADMAELTLSRGGSFAGAVLVIMLGEQILINSGVLFVRAAEGAAAAGFIFNVLMVARAPLVLFQAIAASLLPHLTKLRARGDDASREVFRSSMSATLALVAGFATLTIIAVVAAGPPLMQIAFGDSFDYDRVGLAIVAAGMGFYLAAASLNQAALAQAQAHRAALCWIFAASLFVAFNLTAPLDAFRTVEVGFAASACVLFASLLALYRHPHPAARDLINPGSGEELQAQLSAADEIV